MTADAIVLDGNRQLISGPAITGLMALAAVASPHSALASWLMDVRVMAGDAGHLIAALEAFALTQVADLIGHMVIFWIFRLQGFVMFIKRYTGAVRKRGPTMFQGVAVALGTKVHSSLARQFSRMHDINSR